MAMQYSITRFDTGATVVTAFINGQAYTLSGENARFPEIAAKLAAGDESVADDFNLANLANKRFHEVSDRVSVRDGVVYLDDTAIDEAMGQVVVDYLMEGNENLMPLVRFIERLDDNPSHRSRSQLWDFVRNNGIHIADDGRMVLYKGVIATGTPGVYRSVHQGKATVNGTEQKGHIHTTAGDVVTMPRRDISDDPDVPCHEGLHCGARAYAEGFASVLITTLVGPEHVVCVPNDCSFQKVRVEQYEIMDVLGDRQVNTVRWSFDEDDDEDYPYEDEDDLNY